MILPYVPWPLRRGTYQRVYHLAEQVAARFEVDLFCLSSEPEDVESLDRFEGFCRRVHFEEFQHPPWAPFWTDRLMNPMPVTVRHWWSDEVLLSLKGFAAEKRYDFIWFCDLVLWPYVEALFPDHPVRVMDRSRVDWLFQTEELNTLALSRLERFKRKENLAKIIRLERRMWTELSQMIVCGPDDKSFLLGKGAPEEGIFVLANGANTLFFDADAWPPQPTSHPSALFCGALDYTPNVDGLAWYFESIHDLILSRCADYKVILVGKNPTPLIRSFADRPGVEFAGEVPDVRPFYQKAWMQIVPLRIGGGTRLKIAEGLAMANPVVSTTLGAQGLDLCHERELLLGDTPDEFADKVIRYIECEALRAAHGRQGCATIRKLYTWEALGGLLADRLDQLLDATPS